MKIKPVDKLNKCDRKTVTTTAKKNFETYLYEALNRQGIPLHRIKEDKNSNVNT